METIIHYCNQQRVKCEKTLEENKEYLDKIKELPLEMDNLIQVCIESLENFIQLGNTELQLFNLIINPPAEKTMFPLILKKYDELMEISLDLSKKRVIYGIQPEGNYLKKCRCSLKDRDIIKLLCEIGEK